MPDLRARALKLLSRREYGHYELRQKLAPYASSAQELDDLLGDLQARRLLSDQRYASQRVGARAARYGNQRLVEELRAKGVDEDCVQTALAESAGEEERCRAVWQKKFGVVPETLAERDQQSRFLQGRGFSHEIIRRILRGEME